MGKAQPSLCKTDKASDEWLNSQSCGCYVSPELLAVTEKQIQVVKETCAPVAQQQEVGGTSGS